LRTIPAFALVLFVAAAGACAEAGGEVKGGELTDAGTAATTPPEVPPDTKPTPAPCDGTGTRWSDLYNDIFGPTGKGGSCAFQSNCHGSAEGGGARSLAGIQCFDLKGCRQSFLDKNLVTAKDTTDPDKSILLRGLLRRISPDDGKTIGFMPQAPADYIFSETCVDRMKTWIANGYPDD
jgi:hypothetical protein